MKKIIIHAVPVLISFVWLGIVNHTVNPISLRGPYFLKFYLILIFGFYASIFILKAFKESVSKETFYCIISIFILGIVKLIRGLFLGKPVIFLILILIIELIVIVFFRLAYLNKNLK